MLTNVLSGEQEGNRHQRIFRKVLPNHIHIENIEQKINFDDPDGTEIRLRMYLLIFAL